MQPQESHELTPLTLASDADIGALESESANPIKDALLAWKSTYMNGWRFAVLIAKIQDGELWKDAADAEGNFYSSFSAWWRDHFRLSTSVGLRYGRVGRLWLASDTDTRKAWLRHTVTAATEVAREAAGGSPVEALSVLDSAKSQIDLKRKAVESGTASPGGMRTVRLCVSEDTYAQWMRAYNLVKAVCGSNGSDFPSADEVILGIAQTVELAPELSTIGGRQMTEEEFEEVVTGKAACVQCNSVAHLHRHHVIPRSKGGVDATGEEVLAWLCAKCHGKLHHGKDEATRWADLAERMGVERPQATRPDYREARPTDPQ